MISYQNPSCCLGYADVKLIWRRNDDVSVAAIDAAAGVDYVCLAVLPDLRAGPLFSRIDIVNVRNRNK